MDRDTSIVVSTLIVLVTVFGIVLLASLINTTADFERDCHAKGGTPGYVRGSGNLCLRKDALIK